MDHEYIGQERIGRAKAGSVVVGVEGSGIKERCKQGLDSSVFDDLVLLRASRASFPCAVVSSAADGQVRTDMDVDGGGSVFWPRPTLHWSSSRPSTLFLMRSTTSL